MYKRLAALAAAILVASGLTAAGVAPAAAGSCTVRLTPNFVDDVASVYKTSGDCAYVAVRHFALPSNGGTGYYTAWAYGLSRAQSIQARELQSAEGGYVP